MPKDKVKLVWLKLNIATTMKKGNLTKVDTPLYVVQINPCMRKAC